MPEMDGLTACKIIRREWPSNKQPYIVAMTAGAFREDRVKCMEAGMDNYLSKPIEISKLADILRGIKKIDHESVNINENINHINLDTLIALKDVMADDEIFFELIDTYLNEAPVQIRDMFKLNDLKDYTTLGRIAHTLKTTNAHFGIEFLASLCKNVEVRCKSANFEGLEENLRNIENEFQYIQSELAEFLKENSVNVKSEK